ncbi:DMT family transporter [Basilea psittacipulmonis]|uniref:EamA domain-containing protein n=1 Tax=Basilea psittacipulmonis DSM 24701 TaxID=1072685 RepID=A0A077DD75_9BURK|nr:DMT family transporter [Basilea psittacipulmonis]AIL32559.1 hypothetical protein IX83_03865 [Basilea psittacipulmonis DSM 24701]
MNSPLLQLAAGCIISGLGSLMVATIDMGIYAIAFWRLFIAAVIFLLIMLFGKFPFPKYKQTFFYAALAGILGAVDLMLWHVSIHAIGPGIATLLNSLQVFFLALIGLFFFRESLSKIQTISILVAVVGIALVVWPEIGLSQEITLGLVTGLLSALAFALSMLSIRSATVQEKMPIFGIMFLIDFVGMLFTLPFAIYFDAQRFFPAVSLDWLNILAYGAVMQCLAWFLISKSISHVRLAIVGLLMLAQPTTALLGDGLFLHRVLDSVQYAGILLTMVAIYFGSKRHGA